MPPKSFKPTRERKQRRRAAAASKNHTAGDPEGSPAPQDVAKTSAVSDPNAEIIIPLTAAEKAEKRRQQLKDELKAQQPKMSAKKQKRFNKYIETKLKKEETAAILEKLSETRVDTSLLTSTKSIGASRESKKQQIKRALLEEQAGINMEANKAILYEERRPVDAESLDMHMTDEPSMDRHSDEGSPAPVQPQAQSQPAIPFSIGVTVGAGLKRPLDSDSPGQPVIKRIKKNRKPRKAPVLIINEPEQSDEDTSMEDQGSEEDEGNEEEWTGFSDDDAQASEASEASETSESEDSDESKSSEEDSSEESEDESEGEETVSKLKRGRSEKAAAFKEWALAQRRAVVEGVIEPTKSNIEASMEAKSTLVHVPTSHEEDMTPPPEELRVSQTDRKVVSP
jgi:ATP-dependent RNA helicase DHX37/DHR1